MKCPSCSFGRSWKLRRGASKCKRCRKEWRQSSYPVEGIRWTELHWKDFLHRLQKHESLRDIAKEMHASSTTVVRAIGHVAKALSNDIPEKLSGIVEMDGAYLGGNRLNQKWSIRCIPSKRGRGTSKVPILGVYERSRGIVRVWMGYTETKKCILHIAEKFVTRESWFATDDLTVYCCLNKAGYVHETVDHQAHHYARGWVSTNGIEGFWGTLKKRFRAVGLRKEHYVRFVAIHTWRYNHRDLSKEKQTELIFDLLKNLVAK